MLRQFMSKISKILCDKSVQFLIIIFSFIWGLVKSLAHYVYDKDEININFLHSLGYALICYIMLNLSYFIITRDYKVKPIKIKSSYRLWGTFFFILLLSYAICWLVYWPGTVFIDNWWISKAGINISIQHPIFYCALIQLFVKTGQALGGIHYSVILYTGLQILIVSVVLATLLFNIFQKNIPKVLKYALLFLFVFVPIYPMYGICNVKDVYWSLCIVVMTLCIYNFVSNNPIVKTRKFYIEFCLCLIGIIILRNNGIYIVIPCMLLLLGIKTPYRKFLIFVLGVCLFTQYLCSFSMKVINKKNLFQEKVAAPIQQIAAVVKNNGVMTTEQKKFVEQLMPLEKIKEYYDPYSVDNIKWKGRRYGFNYNFLQNNSKKFLKYWWQMMPSNLGIYVKAFLQVTYWFWAPIQREKVCIYTEALPEQDSSLRPWIMDNGYKITHALPLNFRTHLTSYYNNAGHFLREGVLFWLFLAVSLLYYLKCRKLRNLVIFLPCFVLWCTLMIASPDSRQFRYILPFAYLLPYFICLLFVKNDDCDIYEPLNILNYTRWSSKTKRKFNFFTKSIFAIAFLGFVYLYLVSHIPLKARVDLFAKYTDEPSFYVRLNGYGMPLKEASWMTKNGEHGVVVQQITNRLELVVTAIEDANIIISLRGPDERDANGKRYERWVKYTLFKINGESVMFGNKDVWHDKPYKYVLSAKKNMAYKIELKWRKK